MPNSTEKVEKVLTCDLRSLAIRPIANWKEWLDRWQAAATYQELLGLLHCGFDVSFERACYGETEYDQIDRLVFYFSVADGWLDDHLLRVPGEQSLAYYVGYNDRGQRVEKTVVELRQQLAIRAVAALCSSFFKMELHEETNPRSFGWQWSQTVLSVRLFPIIMNFFRVEKSEFGDGVEVRNLRGWDRKSHSEETVIEWLLKLVRVLWLYEDHDVTDYLHDSQEKKLEKNKQRKAVAATRRMIDEAKPWMIEVLAMLKRTDVLEKWLLQLDKPCLAKLKEIALRSQLTRHVSNDRKVANLDEACFVGSPVAWLLKKRELMEREHKRLSEILKVEQQRKEMDRKLKNLQIDYS